MKRSMTLCCLSALSIIVLGSKVYGADHPPFARGADIHTEQESRRAAAWVRGRLMELRREPTEIRRDMGSWGAGTRTEFDQFRGWYDNMLGQLGQIPAQGGGVAAAGQQQGGAAQAPNQGGGVAAAGQQQQRAAQGGGLIRSRRTLRIFDGLLRRPAQQQGGVAQVPNRGGGAAVAAQQQQQGGVAQVPNQGGGAAVAAQQQQQLVNEQVQLQQCLAQQLNPQLEANLVAYIRGLPQGQVPAANVVNQVNLMKRSVLSQNINNLVDNDSLMAFEAFLPSQADKAAFGMLALRPLLYQQFPAAHRDVTHVAQTTMQGVYDSLANMPRIREFFVASSFGDIISPSVFLRFVDDAVNYADVTLPEKFILAELPDDQLNAAVNILNTVINRQVNGFDRAGMIQNRGDNIYLPQLLFPELTLNAAAVNELIVEGGIGALVERICFTLLPAYNMFIDELYAHMQQKVVHQIRDGVPADFDAEGVAALKIRNMIVRDGHMANRQGAEIQIRDGAVSLGFMSADSWLVWNNAFVAPAVNDGSRGLLSILANRREENRVLFMPNNQGDVLDDFLPHLRISRAGFDIINAIDQKLAQSMVEHLYSINFNNMVFMDDGEAHPQDLYKLLFRYVIQQNNWDGRQYVARNAIEGMPRAIINHGQMDEDGIIQNNPFSIAPLLAQNNQLIPVFVRDRVIVHEGLSQFRADRNLKNMLLYYLLRGVYLAITGDMDLNGTLHLTRGRTIQHPRPINFPRNFVDVDSTKRARRIVAALLSKIVRHKDDDREPQRHDSVDAQGGVDVPQDFDTRDDNWNVSEEIGNISNDLDLTDLESMMRANSDVNSNDDIINHDQPMLDAENNFTRFAFTKFTQQVAIMCDTSDNHMMSDDIGRGAFIDRDAMVFALGRLAYIFHNRSGIQLDVRRMTWQNAVKDLYVTIGAMTNAYAHCANGRAEGSTYLFTNMFQCLGPNELNRFVFNDITKIIANIVAKSLIDKLLPFDRLENQSHNNEEANAKNYAMAQLEGLFGRPHIDIVEGDRAENPASLRASVTSAIVHKMGCAGPDRCARWLLGVVDNEGGNNIPIPANIVPLSNFFIVGRVVNEANYNGFERAWLHTIILLRGAGQGNFNYGATIRQIVTDELTPELLIDFLLSGGGNNALLDTLFNAYKRERGDDMRNIELHHMNQASKRQMLYDCLIQCGLLTPPANNVVH